MTLLDVQHIKKIYKTRFQGTQVEALKDIHFTVEKGEYVAIMGESGSGKSTLLNILAMLDQPTEGRVYLNGTDTSTIKNKDASSFRREKLGFVFQDFNCCAKAVRPCSGTTVSSEPPVESAVSN